jgi:hypothetical protein
VLAKTIQIQRVLNGMPLLAGRLRLELQPGGPTGQPRPVYIGPERPRSRSQSADYHAGYLVFVFRPA